VQPPSSPRLVSTAAALLIGNELLSGKTREANLCELARTLRTLGVRLARVVMVGDEVEVIAREVTALSEGFDVVFTSGGIGPTHDDVTIDAVAQAFGVATCADPGMEALLRAHYQDRCSDAHLRMALVPDGAELATADDVPWPTVLMRNVWVLPGIPEVFRMKLSVVRAWIRGPAPFLTRAVLTRLEEPDLKPLLDQIVAAHPSVEVGSYPKWLGADYRTKITFDSLEARSLQAALDAFLSQVPTTAVVRTE